MTIITNQESYLTIFEFWLSDKISIINTMIMCYNELNKETTKQQIEELSYEKYEKILSNFSICKESGDFQCNKCRLAKRQCVKIKISDLYNNKNVLGWQNSFLKKYWKYNYDNVYEFVLKNKISDLQIADSKLYEWYVKQKRCYGI